MISKSLVHGVRDDVLQLIIMPTEKCNFRCFYCYEDFELGHMSAELVGAVKRLISRRWESLKAMEISWFGGEPLNAIPIVVDIMAHAHQTRPDGAILTSHITTNGYKLNKRNFIDLLDHGVTSYQVTLDGDRDNHDKRRVLANGKGTFDVILSNINDCKRVERDFDITLRIHVHGDTLASLHSFVEELARGFGRDSRFGFFLKPIAHLGGPNDKQVSLVSSEGKKLLTEIAGYGRSLGLRSVEDDVNYICYAAKPNSLVIRSDGSLAKCTVAFNADRNSVGHINNDGSVSLDSEKMNRWAAALFSEHQSDQHCPVGIVLGAVA